MSWNLAIWRGVATDSVRVWDAICDGHPVAGRQVVPRDGLRAALAEAFAGDLRIEGGPGHTDIAGRGWELSLGDDSEVVEVSCSWSCAWNTELMRAMLRAAHATGCSVFDPQLLAFWPEGPTADDDDPWSAVVFDPCGDDLAPFSARLLPDGLDAPARTFIHSVALDLADPDATVLANRMLLSKLGRYHRARPGFRHRVHLEMTAGAADMFDLVSRGLGNVLDAEVVPAAPHPALPCVAPPAAASFAIVGAIGLDDVAALSHRLRRLEVFPRLHQTPAEQEIAAIFEETEIYVSVRRQSLRAASNEVAQELAALWATIVAYDAPDDDDESADDEHAELPAIVDLRTGRRLTPAELCSPPSW